MEEKRSKLYIQHVSESDVRKILKNISNSKSVAIDGLNNYCLKLGADILSGPLHHIITLSLMQETFPQTWKFSKVLPLHKKDDENTPKNYRPVSILSPMSIILERVIHDQL